MRNPKIDECIDRYYIRWCKYSRWLCGNLGIYEEWYDVVTEALEDILNHNEDYLLELINCFSRTNECKFLYTVRNYIKNRALDLRRKIIKIRSKTVRLDDDPLLVNLLQSKLDSSDDTMTDDIYNAERMIEADFRSDSFATGIVPFGLPPSRQVAAYIPKRPTINTRQSKKKGISYSTYYTVKIRYSVSGKIVYKQKKFKTQAEAMFFVQNMISQFDENQIDNLCTQSPLILKAI